MKLHFIILSHVFLYTVQGQEINKTLQEGNEAYKKADFKAASQLYLKALSKDASNHTAKFNLANALQKQNNFASAEKYYDEVVTTSNDVSLKAKAFYNKGVAQVQQKDLPAAIESFKQALALTPDDNEARENLQKAINDLKKTQKTPTQSNSQKEKKQNKSTNKQPNPEMMEQKFNELRDKERQLQKMLQKRPNNEQPEKDW